MKAKTKELAQQVRVALLALSNKVLMETMIEWLDRADEHLHHPDWSAEFRFALGYRILSAITDQLYASFDELRRDGVDEVCASWVIPEAETLRNILSTFPVEQFYHIVVQLARYALSDRAYEEKWGDAPSPFSDGYDFMRCLATHLHHRAYLRPENGHILLSLELAQRRKDMYPPHAPLFAGGGGSVSVSLDDLRATRACQSSHSPDSSDQIRDLDR